MDLAIPLIRRVDVVVVGGGVAGVAAAAAAARAGRRVFLGAAQTYLGEDVCATGHLWVAPDECVDTPLARRLFLQADGQRSTVLCPMDVKRSLDDELIEAGVDFLFGSLPADLLVDEAGRVSGVVFTGKSGLFAVSAGAVIDATPWASVAQLAGLRFTAWSDALCRVRRVVVGHRAEGDDGALGRLLPGRVTGLHGGRRLEHEAFAYEFDLPLAGVHPQALAELEQAVRDRTWHRDQVWSSDRLEITPPHSLADATACFWDAPGQLSPDAGHTGEPGLFVVGPCAARNQADRARLLVTGEAIAAGHALGVQVAAACETHGPSQLHARHGHAADVGVHEPCTCDRFLVDDMPRIAGPAGQPLPDLGSFDVVVVGGGTGGAPAALAAARTGARVLLLESLAGLGGVGTQGFISIYYHGYREGFTAEVTAGLRELWGDAPDFQAHRWNSEHKAEWLRREIRRAGGQIWFGAHVSGAHLTGTRVDGVVVNTACGRGLVRAGMVIDATGNADVAAAAGADCRIVSSDELAIQGSGLPPRPFLPAYHNTDYTFIDDTDPVDLTRAFVVARRKFADAFDLGQLPDTRERRQIVGDVTLSPLDVYTGRPWSDAICLSRSNFDSHGFTLHPLFVVLPPDRVSLDAWLPLRALLPKGFSGLLVTGLALSGHRDVMPVFRMQPDIQNHAYAAGLAAVMALACKGEARRIDIRMLQRRLVAKDILPQFALLLRDAPAASRTVLLGAAKGELDVHAELAVLMSSPDTARLMLRQRLADERDPVPRLACARLLAAMGDATGVALLTEHVRSSAWDTGWNYTGMGQFGRSLSPLDDAIVALAYARAREGKAAVLARLLELGPASEFSHVRAVALYCETFGDVDFAAPLAALLRQPGVGGHACTRLPDELSRIPASAVDTTTRNAALRELYLARALLRCGDPEGVARETLGRYVDDLRGHFARHARAVLARAAVR